MCQRNVGRSREVPWRPVSVGKGMMKECTKDLRGTKEAVTVMKEVHMYSTGPGGGGGLERGQGGSKHSHLLSSYINPLAPFNTPSPILTPWHLLPVPTPISPSPHSTHFPLPLQPLLTPIPPTVTCFCQPPEVWKYLRKLIYYASGHVKRVILPHVHVYAVVLLPLMVV